MLNSQMKHASPTESHNAFLNVVTGTHGISED